MEFIVDGGLIEFYGKHMNQPKEQIRVALKKAHTSLGRIIETLDFTDSCYDVIQQNLAVIGLLKSANKSMLESHIERVVTNVDKPTPMKLKRMKEEIIRAVAMSQNKF